MTDFDWKKEISSWLINKKSIQSYERDLIEFFNNVFENTCYPEKSFFGVLKSSISLTIGGLYLAAYSHGTEAGIWLLVDKPHESIEGVHFMPVKSTNNSNVKLTWLHLSIENLNLILKNKAIWDSYKLASQIVINVPLGKSIREDRNQNKTRLSEFWQDEIFIFPEEIITQFKTFTEGSVKQITVNAYERDGKARQECLKIHKCICKVCGFDFEKTYGNLGRGFIHVHHIKPLFEIKKEYKVNPEEDLVPVCPNCHAMLHRRKEVLSINELKALIHR